MRPVRTPVRRSRRSNPNSRNGTPKRYGYSYDREDYTGNFESAEAAFNEAVANLQTLANPPTTIYVGTLVNADPQAGDHALGILDAMKQRALVDYGDPARNYLKGVTGEQAKELEAAIEATILAWLGKHKLAPNFVSVEGIREYPVPMPVNRPRVRPNGEEREVQEIGTAEGPEI